jgi:DNA-binding beta-propeller fold protein YncE
MKRIVFVAASRLAATMISGTLVLGSVGTAQASQEEYLPWQEVRIVCAERAETGKVELNAKAISNELVVGLSAIVVHAEPGPAATPTNPPPRVIRSFHDLPEQTTVVKEFRRDAPEVLAQHGITLTAGSDKPTGHDYRFWGPCTVADDQLHGTVAAPFSATAFMVQHPNGPRLAFRKPQRIVALTIAGPTTRTEAAMELRFSDTEGRLLATVAATTQHDPQLPFDSRGAIFRGLDTGDSLTGRCRAQQPAVLTAGQAVWSSQLTVTGATFEIMDGIGHQGAEHAPRVIGPIAGPSATIPWRNPPVLGHGVDSPANLLVAAAKRGDNAVLERLLDDGTPSDTRNSDGQSALELAVANGQRDAVLLLLARGAPLWGQNAQGESLLHVAVGAKQQALLELLLALGVPQGLVEANGRSPLDLARQHAASDLVETLRRPPPMDWKPVQQAIDRQRRVNAVKLSARAEGVVLNTDGRHGWVFARDTVTGFDTASGDPGRCVTTTAEIASACFQESPDNNGTLRLLTAAGITVLDLLTGKLGDQSGIFGQRPDWRLAKRSTVRSSVLAADGRFWWLSSAGFSTALHGAVPPALFRVDLSTSQFAQIAGRPMDQPGAPELPAREILLAAGSNGQMLVSSVERDAVAVYAPDGDKPVREFVLPHRPLRMAATADGALVTVATNELAATDIATGKLLQRVALPGQPTALCVEAAGNNAFVAVAGSDMVSVVDLRRGRSARGIEVVRPLGRSGADAGRGRSVCGIGALCWADNPRRLIGLGYSGNVLFVARY